MKKIATILLSAIFMLAAVPTFANTAQEKETCAIAANDCLNKADILQKKIKRLKAQIKKGEGKYSADDMKKLEQKLQDAMDQLDKMEETK